MNKQRTNETEDKRKRPTSIQVPDALDARMAEAMELTGESQSALFVACAEKSLNDVVQEIMERKKAKLLAFYKANERASGRQPPPASSVAVPGEAGVSRKTPTKGRSDRPKRSGGQG